MKERKKTITNRLLTTLIVSSAIAGTKPTLAQGLAEALENGTGSADLRLRYERVDQDSSLDTASALTLRSRVSYTTGTYRGFSAVVEMEDNRIMLDRGDYTVPQTNYNTNEFSVILDPEQTELDQGFLQFQHGSKTVKFGRQVLTFDNHRFVGHVGWRQDRQTFDGITFKMSILDNLIMHYGYIEQRNRIVAEATDLSSKDHLLNLKYQGPSGTLVGYVYLLDVDNGTDNALDTVGVRYTGTTSADNMKLLYAAEMAAQTNENPAFTDDLETYYVMFEGGMVVKGITAKLGYELLSTDDGQVGFATPLATLHKFNGWADIFAVETPATGLVDLKLSLSGTVLGGRWSVSYHDFQPDEETDAIDDLGSELDLLFAKKFGKLYSAGIKYAAFSAEDQGVDTDKLWVWFGVSI